MIVLIVLAVLFVLIIVAIIVLICLRRRKEKLLTKEYSSGIGSNGKSTPISTIREKPFTSPFQETTVSTLIRSYENTTEVHGTYKANTNAAYDNSDNSLGFNSGRPTLMNGGGKMRPRIDTDEYWRTNI